MLEAQVHDDLDEARTKSSIDGGAPSRIGEAQQSRRYKIILGVIILVIIVLVISDCLDGSTATAPRTL